MSKCPICGQRLPPEGVHSCHGTGEVPALPEDDLWEAVGAVLDFRSRHEPSKGMYAIPARLLNDLGGAFLRARCVGQPAPPAERPRIVCLCGSTRFKEAYIAANERETMQGHIVLSVGLFGHRREIPLTDAEKAMLDELHLRKIDLCDKVLVLNIGGYIGESTRREIEYATQIGKPVFYAEDHDSSEEVTVPPAEVCPSCRGEHSEVCSHGFHAPPVGVDEIVRQAVKQALIGSFADIRVHDDNQENLALQLAAREAIRLRDEQTRAEIERLKKHQQRTTRAWRKAEEKVAVQGKEIATLRGLLARCVQATERGIAHVESVLCEWNGVDVDDAGNFVLKAALDGNEG